jgi:hypothetical protein
MNEKKNIEKVKWRERNRKSTIERKKQKKMNKEKETKKYE